MRVALPFSTAMMICLIALAGCNSSGGDVGFARSADKVSTGATKDEVRAKLGEPEARRRFVVRGTDPHKTPELAQVLPANTPYERWVYRRGNTDYLFYFASGSN